MLSLRILSAVVGIPLAAVLVFAGAGDVFALAVAVLAALGIREFYAGARRLGAAPLQLLGIATGVLFVLETCVTPLVDLSPVFLALFLLALIWELFRRDRAPVRDLGATALGALYVGWLFSYLVLLRQTSGEVSFAGWSGGLAGWFDLNSRGPWLVLLTLLIVWACDTFAYFSGRAFGRHKLAPSLSPGKTIEGAVGGLLGAVAATLAFGGLAAVPMWGRLIIGLAAGVFCQLGDLCESAMKREMAIKDSGSLIPGHGGVLDRFDSLLFAGPVVYYLTVWLRL